MQRSRERALRAHAGMGDGARDSAVVRRAVADAVVRRYARLAGAAGGATALTGVIPGIGTALAAVGGATADMAATMKLQVDMCMCLAEAFDYDLTGDDGKNLCLLIAASSSLEHAGVEMASRVASEAGVRLLRGHLHGAALAALQSLFRRLGLVLTRKALERSIPFGVGVALSGAGNYALTRYVGRQALAWFELDAGRALRR